MATSIRELSYLLLDMVNGGLPTDDSKINYRIAKAHIKNSVAFFIRRKFWEEKGNSEESYVGSSTSKEVEVKYDEENDNYYVDSLGESIDTTTKSVSITHINPNSRWAIKYIPITKQEMFNQSMVKARIPNVVQYYLQGDKFYFTNGEVDAGTPVVLSQSNLIPSDDDDSVPSDVGAQALEQAYRTVYPEIALQSDRSNDGVPNN